jgi:putative chitinase
MTLKKGSKGDEVKILQEKLGIKNPDGDFGPNTEKKLKEWQKANGILDNGIAGPDTFEKLGITMTKVVESVNTNQGISLDSLKGHIPSNVISQIPDVMEKFQINTPLRLAHFLSQCSHESGGFKVVSENLNYSENGLITTFKSDFDANRNRIIEANEKLKAKQLSRNPQAIANFVYANQNGNGNEKSGDGWKYRGRGYIQLTGRANYASFDRFVTDDIINNPDLVATKYPLLSAAWFFHKYCLEKTDKGDTDVVVSAVTKCVNGGYNGIEDRKKHFKEYYKFLSGRPKI